MASEPSSSPDNGQDSLAWLIEPLPTSEFTRVYYERRLCLVSRSAPSYYDDLLSSEELDRVLGTHVLNRPEINLVRGEDDVERRSYSDAAGRIDPVETSKRFAEGATIIFNQLQRRVPALARLCVSLGKTFGSRVQTNIYLTPPDAQGFKPHWDTHDVFVLQISGRKQWSVYGTEVTLPLKGQSFDSALHRPGPVTEEFELEAGSVVYIPRGLMHSARSSAEASLHITLGITAFTWMDFFVESVAAAGLKDSRLRQSLPMGFASGTVSAEERMRIYREKLSILQSEIDPEPVWRHFQDDLLAKNAPLFTNLLGSHLQTTPITPDSIVSRRTDMFVVIERVGESCVVRFRGTEISFPIGSLPAIEMATTTDSFKARSLPDCLDADGKVTLVTRLLKEGLLVRDPKRSERQV